MSPSLQTMPLLVCGSHRKQCRRRCARVERGASLSGRWGSVSVVGVVLLAHVLIVIGCIGFMVPVLCTPVTLHHIHLQAIHPKSEKEQCQLMKGEAQKADVLTACSPPCCNAKFIQPLTHYWNAISLPKPTAVVHNPTVYGQH